MLYCTIGAWQLLLLLSNLGFCCIRADPQVPCYFIFGDSLYDSGNNNLLATTFKSNYFPYGIDFPRGPSGRFSNGYNTADAYAKLLGFPNIIPPYVEAVDNKILQGVNYASGGAGIRDETSYTQGQRIPLNLQLKNHQVVISRISVILGGKEAAEGLLKKCIYTIGIGSNDYLNNYLLPQFYNTNKIYTPDQYAAVLIEQLAQQLMVLYCEGARKVALLGLGAVGCAPFVGTTFGGGGSSSPCVDSINSNVQLFNAKLPMLVDEFNSKFPGAHFTYIDNFSHLFPGNLTAQGFRVENSSCCERVAGELACHVLGNVCSNKTEYFYWDGVHPTQALASYAAESTYTSVSSSTVHSYDIKTLALLPNN